jgi:DNA-binding GntR family transcriptional regulator
VPEFKQAPPKYVQIADSIRDRILKGDLRPGDEVPSERQLAAEWSVARPTATKALDVLRREGHVAGRQGAGTYVVDLAAFHRQASERYRRSLETGQIYLPNERARILGAEVVDAPDEVVQALGLSAPVPAARRLRLTLRDDEPVELSTSWFEMSVVEAAPRLVAAERIMEGTIVYIERSTGRRPTVARDRTAARLATADEAELLGLERPSAVLVTRHVAYDDGGRPLEFVESVVPPATWTVEHEYPIGR